MKRIEVTFFYFWTEENYNLNMKILIAGGSGFIGADLADLLAEKKIDIKTPSKASHAPYWKEVDILNLDLMTGVLASYKPSHVIHLAANLEDYNVNTEGTRNALHAIKQQSSLERVIITSTQFVCKPGRSPDNGEYFDPHTTYGQSKVVTEQLTRSANLQPCWRSSTWLHG